MHTAQRALLDEVLQSVSEPVRLSATLDADPNDLIAAVKKD
jgi:hypothetical protein